MRLLMLLLLVAVYPKDCARLAHRLHSPPAVCGVFAQLVFLHFGFMDSGKCR